MAVNITQGTGSASVASELVGNNQYQQIKVVDGTASGTTPLKVNADGSITASVYGSLSVTPVANQSVSGTVAIAGTVPVSGSIAALQGTNPWIITGSVQASITPAANQSVSGTVVTTQGTNPWIITGSVQGSFSPSGNQSVSGTVITTQGTNPWIITGSVQGSFSPSGNQSVSGTVGASIIGLPPFQMRGGGINLDVMQEATVKAVTTGVAVMFKSDSNSSMMSVVAPATPMPVIVQTGSVITVQQASSIVGTYAEDAAHTTGEKGLFVLQVRNDQMASITAADGNYSPIAGGPVGETIVANSPITKWVQGTADLRGNAGGSVAVIAAQGTSIFTYVTGVQIANMGSASVLVTLSGATSSIVGYTIAPAGGGSNIVFPNALKTNANGAFTASISGQASVLVSAQGFVSKT